MRQLKLVMSTIGLALALALVAAPADAHHGCRYDPYGYNAPSRDCGHPYREYWGEDYAPYAAVVVPAYPVYPIHPRYRFPVYPRDGWVTVPVYMRTYGPPPGCHYDNGWYRTILVCY